MEHELTLRSRAVGAVGDSRSSDRTAAVRNTNRVADSSIGFVQSDLRRASDISFSSRDLDVELASSGFSCFLDAVDLDRTSLNLERKGDFQALANFEALGLIDATIALFNNSRRSELEDIEGELAGSERDLQRLIGIDIGQRIVALTTSDGLAVRGVGNRRGVDFVKREDASVATDKIDIRVICNISVILLEINHCISSLQLGV